MQGKMTLCAQKYSKSLFSADLYSAKLGLVWFYFQTALCKSRFDSSFEIIFGYFLTLIQGLTVIRIAAAYNAVMCDNNI